MKGKTTMNLKKSLAIITPLTLAIMGLSGCHKAIPGDTSSANDIGGSGVITIDGGGDISNFNTTASMTKSDSNPYPYNTLETLCNEWSKAHPNYTVKINKTSAGGDRETLLAQLQTGTSCDIIYQNGLLVNTDLGKNFYADLTPYLDKENPYNNNKPWKEVYNAGELATTQATDGHYYYVNLEKNPVCFMYNKTLLNAAGVSNPEKIATFGQLIDAMNKLKASFGSSSENQVYSTTYTWYQLAMETNLFSDYVKVGDTLTKNNIVGQEEMCRLISKGIFDPAGDRFVNYVKQIQQLDQYKAPKSYYAAQGWLSGKLGFLEATGAQLRSFASSEVDFEWGTISFPDITTADNPDAKNGVVRGVAGLASSWWVSNHAMNTNKVDACVDLMMYLTSPQQNNRLIGDLKGGIPLNPSNDYELSSFLKPLVEQYDKDIVEAENGNRVYWSAFSPRSVLGNNFSDNFIRTMQNMDDGTVTAEEAAASLARSIKNTVNSLIIEYDYSWDD